MKITLLEISNFKRLKAFRLEPSPEGLTIIGGKNAQGKTTALDAIAYALGGEAYRPSAVKRDGALADPIIHLETDDGLVIERKGKNSSLTVTDSTGKLHGQRLVSSLISRLAIDLPKFLDSSDREKAETLLQILGVGEELAAIDRDVKAKYDLRTAVGRMRDQKQKAAEDMPWHEGLPEAPLSVAELVKAQQDILARNGRKEEHRRNYEANKDELARVSAELERLAARQKALQAALRAAEAEDFTLESTAELEAQIADHEEINRKIAENAQKRLREDEAADLADQYDTLSGEIKDLREKRLALLQGANLPLPNLSIGEDGALTLNGKAWDCMSGAEQMIVGTAIASRLNPACQFVLLDKLEQLDLDTLKDFDNWLSAHNLQAIATRVSNNTDGECTLVIENGEVKEDAPKIIPRPAALSDEDY